MPIEPKIPDRDTELRIKGHLYKIRAVNDEVLGSQQGLPMAEKGYETTLRNVADCADVKSVDKVAAYIKQYIQDRESRPPNRKVRRRARQEVSEAGYPPTSYLNAA